MLCFFFRPHFLFRQMQFVCKFSPLFPLAFYLMFGIINRSCFYVSVADSILAFWLPPMTLPRFVHKGGKPTSFAERDHWSISSSVINNSVDGDETLDAPIRLDERRSRALQSINHLHSAVRKLDSCIRVASDGKITFDTLDYKDIHPLTPIRECVDSLDVRWAFFFFLFTSVHDGLSFSLSSTLHV